MSEGTPDVSGSYTSVIAVLSITVAECRKLATLDIGGAFLNASMETGGQVHMRLDKTMPHVLTDNLPYVDKTESLAVRLDKALYGCVELDALWHEHLSQTSGMNVTRIAAASTTALSPASSARLRYM